MVNDNITQSLKNASVLAFLFYMQKTVLSIAQHHRQLMRQKPPQNMIQLSFNIVKYTSAFQIMAVLEYFICIVKPRIALRVAKLLLTRYYSRHVHINLAYGKHERQKMDIYTSSYQNITNQPDLTKKCTEEGRKKQNSSMKCPVLIFVHGGAWCFGDKWQYALVGDYLSKKLGIVVAVINYRTYPIGSIESMVNDIKAAVAWVSEHCEKFGGDKNKIYLSGHSSGAHVCALALILSAMQCQRQKQNQLDKKIEKHETNEIIDHIKGFIGYSGPYDISSHYIFESNRQVGPINGVHNISPMKPAMLGKYKFQQKSPTCIMKSVKQEGMNLPIFYCVHGTDDTTVPNDSSLRLSNAMKTGVYVEVKNCAHEDIPFALMGDRVTSRDKIIDHLRDILFPVIKLNRTDITINRARSCKL